jgi:hypothetical protein
MMVNNGRSVPAGNARLQMLDSDAAYLPGGLKALMA